MLTVKSFTFNPFQENTYVLYDDTKECVIIDPGCYEKGEEQELLDFIKQHDLTVKLLLNTHCHIDHVLGNYFVKNEIALSAFAFENHKLRLRHSDGFSVEYKRPQHFILGYQLAAGLEFRLNKNLNLAVVPTFTGDFKRNDPQLGKLPGHSTFGVNLGANWWF